jgi:c(7)-type cytochrome triheme protein
VKPPAGIQASLRFSTTVGVLLAGLGLGALHAVPGGAQVRMPSDFGIAKSDGSPGQVTFSHDRHRAKVEKCTVCHMRDFKMKRGASGPITLSAKQEGKFCGGCHDGKTTMGGAVVFPIDECDRCHK